MKFLTPLFCTLFAAVLTAQSPVWTGETETEITLRSARQLQPELSLTHVDRIGRHFHELVEQTYGDRYPLRPSLVDTIVTFDPETFEESVVIVRTDHQFVPQSYTLRQRWTLDGSGNLRVVTVAFRPNLTSDGTDAFTKLDPTRVTNAAAVSPAAHQIETTHTLADFKTLQGDLNAFVRYYYFEAPQRKTDGVMQHYYGPDDARNVALSGAELIELQNGVQTDTLVTFYPEDYSEYYEIIRTDVRPETVTDLRSVQTLYWDPTHRQPATKLHASGPGIERTVNGTPRVRAAFWVEE